MRRRDFLKSSAAATACGIWTRASAAAEPAQRTLVLVELNGGNDGLNAVVPYADPAYRRLRPKLAIARDAVLQLDERFGLHPGLEPLMQAWQARDLAIVHGVGYPRPDRSHFRSIEIVETASDSAEVLNDGWVASVWRQSTQRPAIDGIALGGPAGALTGAGVRPIVMTEPDAFIDQASRMPPPQAAPRNLALAHLMNVRTDIRDAAHNLSAQLQQAPALSADFPSTPIGRQFAAAARLLIAGVSVAAIKLRHGGFDTHANQQRQQANLLTQFAAAVAAFRASMLSHGRWDGVLVMTYAEFGRRAAENASGGTDHGTAAPHFMLGGAVAGGLHGEPPSLTNLEDGDLRHTVDFRRLYATVAQRWWRLPRRSELLAGHAPLEILKS